ncbi:hypothetical protein [Maridesulfovibrio frigidus]|uniref:hypothetical protein n=1 Tax=Maridesulfovibrio frigidus TaxID=340956 RepID=UPI0004E10478|nr:hypothetical protein [Maridesulfovibrio frigidus]
MFTIKTCPITEKQINVIGARFISSCNETNCKFHHEGVCVLVHSFIVERNNEQRLDEIERKLGRISR